mgnify:CR=1 FL=1
MVYKVTDYRLNNAALLNVKKQWHHRENLL